MFAIITQPPDENYDWIPPPSINGIKFRGYTNPEQWYWIVETYLECFTLLDLLENLNMGKNMQLSVEEIEEKPSNWS